MKQRLLLSLLMLFVSVGILKAEVTITVPKGAAPVISVSGITTGQEPMLSINGTEVHKFTSSALSYTVKADNEKDQIISISNNPHKVLTITGAGSIMSLTVDSYNTLEEINIPNTGVKTITWTNAPGLKKLDISGNPGVSMGVLPMSLESLNISGNKFSIPNNAAWDLSTYAKLNYLNIDGNQLVSVTLPADFEKNKGTFVTGIQDFSSQVKDTQHKANQNFDISTFNWGLGNGIIAASEWKRQDINGNYKDTEDAHHPENNSVIYRFYDDATGVYQSGVYQCVLERENGFKYRVGLNIESPKFTIKRATLPNAAKIIAYNEAGDNVFDLSSQEVLQGAKLKIGVQFTDENYEFVRFKDVKGLIADEGDWTKNNIQCTVAGKFVNWDKDETPYIDAEIEGVYHKITFNTPDVEKGYVEVFAQDEKGDYTIKVGNGGSVVYGSSIKIVATPANSGLTPSLVVNNTEVELTEESGKHIAVYKVEKPIVISVDFTPKSSVVVKAFVNEAAISTSTTPNSIDIKGGNDENKAINSSTGVKLLVDQEYQMTFTVPESYNTVVNKIIIGSQEVKFETTSSNGYVLYRANFKVPATDPNIYISTSTATALSIKAENIQKVTYDGKAHAFEFATDPASKESDFELTYVFGNVSAKDAPSAVGTYEVTFTYKGDDAYSYTPATGVTYQLVIEKATPTFATLPTVTYADGKYTCTGETTNRLEGEFEVTAKTGQDITKSHLVDVIFTPTNKNYNPVTFTQEALVDGKAMERTPVTVINNNKDVQVTVLNAGSVPANLKGEYLKGTELTIKVVYPEGVKPEEVVVKPTLLSTAALNPSESNLSARTLIYTYEVPGGTQGEEIYVTVNSKLDWTYKVVLASDQKAIYNGKVHEYPEAKITLTGDNADPNKAAVTLAQLQAANKITISYVGVDGLPEDAGVYSVRVQIKAGDGYQAFDQTFENCFEIEKATPEIKTWPKACPISNGLTLKYAKLEGGESPYVAGTFKWADESYIPKKGEKCLVKFVPDDQDNYNVAYSGTENATAVTVVDQPLVMYHTNYPEQTTITVTDATGKKYESGTPVSEGTVLTIKATTNNDKLELVSLTVNGSSISNNTYTVGNGVVAIDATFQIKKEDPVIDKEGQYAVIFPDMVRGAKISYTGDPIVERDKDFKFTVTTLAADVSKLVVKANGSTLTRAADGSYTIKKVQEKQNVTVSFSSTPTEVKVNIPLIYHEKGQPTSGRVQIINNTSNDGKYYYNDELTLIAYPETGVEFSSWSDKNKDSVRDIVLDKAEVSLQAVFTGTPVTGIEDIESAAIYTGRGFIMVKNVANAKVTVVSISGRLQAQEEVNGDTRIDVPQGIYVVVLESGSDAKRMKVIVK